MNTLHHPNRPDAGKTKDLFFKGVRWIGMACLLGSMAATAQVAPPQAQPCPAEVAKDSQCMTGRDSAGATYWLVMPPNWNGTLVVHAHGGPELGTPKPERATEDATRWAIWSRVGYGYASCTADPVALKDFSLDADPQDRIPVPVLTMHGINDAVAFVELESTFKDTMTSAGSGQRLVQVFTQDANHSYSSDAQYVTAMRALLVWSGGGNKPTPASVASQCAVIAANFEAPTACRFLPEFQPQPLASRVLAR